jgi:hypothetical protein
MTKPSDARKLSISRRPEFRSLLDQLETKIEHDISDPGAFAALTRRLILLDKQREKLGEIPEKTPAVLPKDVAERRLRFWPKRRERS